jgi:hypothetical protein
MLAKNVSRSLGSGDVTRVTSVSLDSWILSQDPEYGGYNLWSETQSMSVPINTTVVGMQSLFIAKELYSLFSHDPSDVNNMKCELFLFPYTNAVYKSIANIEIKTYGKPIDHDAPWTLYPAKRVNLITKNVSTGNPYYQIFVDNSELRSGFKIHSEATTYFELIIWYIDDSFDSIILKGSAGAQYI